MKPDEIVFAIPGDRQRRILTFAELDEIILKEIHDWEDRVHAGYVEVFRKSRHNDEAPLKSMGMISLLDVGRKFG
jgi:hypothetical protein